MADYRQAVTGNDMDRFDLGLEFIPVFMERFSPAGWNMKLLLALVRLYLIQKPL